VKLSSKRSARIFWLAAALGTASLLSLSMVPRAAAAQGSQKREDIALAIGETKTIPAAGIDQYTEGQAGIVSVQLTDDKSQFVLRAVKPGSTTLLLIRKDKSQVTYDISVAQRPPQVVEKELVQLLEGIPGIRVRRVGGRVFIEGGVSSESDSKRIQQIASLYQGQVESVVTVGQGAADRKLLMRLDFYFVQYEKSWNYTVGIGWPDSIGGVSGQGQQIVATRIDFDFIAKTATRAEANIVNQPMPRLDIGSRYGWVRIMKQSTVITSNGSEATFQSGGEQNFQQVTANSVGLVKVQFGTNVTVLPRYDVNSKDVEIKLAADVADLTPAASGTVPGRSTTKLETLVTLKLGQALVLSGIKTQTRRRDSAGLPGLAQLPVVGALFGSQRWDNAETEGAVFIIPSVVDSVPKSSLEIINNALNSFKDYSGDIDNVEAFPKAPPSAK
jgi:pilus assembly protein CpaC